MSQNDGPVTSKVEAVMARIRTSYSASRDDASGPKSSTRAPLDDGSVFSEEVFRNLHQARTIEGRGGLSVELGWRTPIIGPAWMVVRQRIHQEIRIYFDSLTSQQTSLNSHFLRALTGVVEGVDAIGLRRIRRQQQEHDAAIRKLQDEVSQLRSEIQALHEAQPSQNSPRSFGESGSRD